MSILFEYSPALLPASAGRNPLRVDEHDRPCPLAFLSVKDLMFRRMLEVVS